MTSHLTEDQIVGLLHGTLAAGARDDAKRHLAGCAACADALAREAALDAMLHEARRALPDEPAAVSPAAVSPAPPPPAARKPPQPGLARWVAGALGVAAATAIAYTGSADVASAGKLEMGLSAWQNVIFYIPLAVGLLLILGSAFGVHDHDPGHAADQHGATHDPGHDSLFARGFAILGVGRVPLTIVLMITSLYFGGLGIILNTLLASVGLAPWLYGPISIAGAFVGMMVLGGATARLIHRHLPMSETYSISRHDLAGSRGKLLLPADTSSGYAQIKDLEGNVHNIRCRTTAGTLAKDAAILVVEYDEETKTFIIDANPEPPFH